MIFDFYGQKEDYRSLQTFMYNGTYNVSFCVNELYSDYQLLCLSVIL